MLKKLLNKNFLLILGADILFLALAWYCSFLLRFNFHLPDDYPGFVARTLPLIVIIKIVTFYLFDLYRGMWRYTSIGDMFRIVRAASVVSVLIFFFIYFVQGLGGFARSVFIIDWILTIAFISGHRISVRLYYWIGTKNDTTRVSAFDFLFGKNSKHLQRKRLLIIGAGDCGEKIYREIHDNARLEYNVVGFIDDKLGKVGRQIHGIPIFGPISDLGPIVSQLNADEMLIAIPSASSRQMRNTVSICKEKGLPFKTVPGMGELIDGKVSIKTIRDVAYHDLLGRELIRLEEERIGDYLNNAIVFVSGAGGSIGAELCRQICRFRPEKIVLHDRAESALYGIDIELRDVFPFIKIVPLLADIRNLSQLSSIFDVHQPQAVFHAAAYKHVPMLESHPWEAITNNVVGTRNLIDVSNRFGVKRFVFVSTDKAVRPTNIMGASKRISELLVQGQNGCGISSTIYVTVRFGNVVGSIGSVVPLFKKQIEKGGPITVTHPDVMRYFMTIPEACQLILQAGSMGEGGEIFSLDMGTPIKIVDMANDLIRLSGFEPDVDINIEFIGLRPGEKLYEELITDGEGIVPTSHEKIMVLRGQTCDQSILNGQIDDMVKVAQQQDAAGIRSKLKEILPEYSPSANS